jgi:hypothetical protein
MMVLFNMMSGTKARDRDAVPPRRRPPAGPGRVKLPPHGVAVGSRPRRVARLPLLSFAVGKSCQLEVGNGSKFTGMVNSLKFTDIFPRRLGPARVSRELGQPECSRRWLRRVPVTVPGLGGSGRLRPSGTVARALTECRRRRGQPEPEPR